jgi:hypothetical protein
MPTNHDDASQRQGVDNRQILIRQRFTLAHEIGHVQLEHRQGNAASLFGRDEPEVFACTEEGESLDTMDRCRRSEDRS